MVLNFTVEGEEPEEWKLSYVAEGEEEQVLSFSDHSVTVSGLTIGKVYTFTPGCGRQLVSQWPEPLWNIWLPG